jgi:Uri superfamily endonuclease
MHKIESKPGTCCVLFRSHKRRRTQIGRWGCLYIEPGYYLYVGSAFGPGGVAARVLWHCRKSRRSTAKHWHMDYLKDHVTPVVVWCSYALTCLEHRWARRLLRMAEMTPIDGFGCSDCQCQTHLFHTSTEPASDRIINAVDGNAKMYQKRE